MNRMLKNGLEMLIGLTFLIHFIKSSLRYSHWSHSYCCHCYLNTHVQDKNQSHSSQVFEEATTHSASNIEVTLVLFLSYVEYFLYDEAKPFPYCFTYRLRYRFLSQKLLRGAPNVCPLMQLFPVIFVVS